MAANLEVERKFMTSCHQMGLGMFTGMDMFPLSGGDISWNDKQEQAAILAQLGQWRAYDDMLSEGRSQIVWPVLLQMAFPFMTGWPLMADFAEPPEQEVGPGVCSAHRVCLWHGESVQGSHPSRSWICHSPLTTACRQMDCVCGWRRFRLLCPERWCGTGFSVVRLLFFAGPCP